MTRLTHFGLNAGGRWPGVSPLTDDPAAGWCAAGRAMVLLTEGRHRIPAITLAVEALVDDDCVKSPLCVWSALSTALCAGAMAATDGHLVRLIRMGRTELAEVLTLVRAGLARRVGDLDGAHRLLSALDVGGVTPTVRYLVLPWMVSSFVERGDLAAAHAFADAHDLDGLIEQTPDATPLLRTARARLRMADGAYQDAAQEYLTSGQLLTAANVLNPALVPWRSKAALALARTGDTTKARQLAEEELDLALRWGEPATVGWSLYVKAKVIGLPEAQDTFEEAIELLDLANARAQACLACHDLGVELAAVGELAAARRHLDRAVELARWCGHQGRQRDATVALDRISDVDTTASLTRQEAKIARLARAGYRNKEIADKLFLTVRTVEFHLSSVYRKLGVAGRRELRNCAHRLD